MNFIDKKNDLVHAYAIDETHIYIKCSKCKYHRHGSCGNLLNRNESRSGHCPYFKYYDIQIDDNTYRGSVGRTGRLLKRSRKKMDALHECQKQKQELYLMEKEDKNVLTVTFD